MARHNKTTSVDPADGSESKPDVTTVSSYEDTTVTSQDQLDTGGGSPGGGGSAFAHLTESTNAIKADWPIQIGGTVGEVDLGTDGFVDIFFDDTSYTGATAVFRIEKWNGGHVFEVTADGQINLNNAGPFTPGPAFLHLTEEVTGLHYDGDVNATGSVTAGVNVEAAVFICTVPGQGMILTSPDGLTVKLVTIDNSGALVVA